MLEAGTFPNVRPHDIHVVGRPGPSLDNQRPYTATGNGPTASRAVRNVDPFHVPQTGTNHTSAIHFDTRPMVQPYEPGLSQSQPSPPAAVYNGLSMRASQEDASKSIAPHAIVPIMPAVIDVYPPRPSTAPAQVSQHLSQMLPPRRDLPFKVTKSGHQETGRSPGPAPTKAKAKKKTQAKVKLDPIVSLVPDSQGSAGIPMKEEVQPLKVVTEPTASQPLGDTKKSCEACRRKKVSVGRKSARNIH
jgi:hypothetical protein